MLHLGLGKHPEDSRSIAETLLGSGILLLISNRLGNRRLANFSDLVVSTPNERSRPYSGAFFIFFATLKASFDDC